MPKLQHLSKRQLAYCKLRAEGLNRNKSYTGAGYKSCNTPGDYSNASKLEKDPRVAEMINTLKGTNLIKDALSIEEKRSFLARAVRCDIRNPDPDLIQEVTETESERGSSRKIKTVGKLEAIALDNKMAGDNWEDRQAKEVRHNPFLFLVALSKGVPEFLNEGEVIEADVSPVL